MPDVSAYLATCVLSVAAVSARHNERGDVDTQSCEDDSGAGDSYHS